MKQPTLFSLSLASALSLAACMSEETDLDTELSDNATAQPDSSAGLGEVTQQLGSWGVYPASCSNGNFCYTELGTLDERTCFLGGLSGDYRDGYAVVSRINGRFRLDLRAATGKQVGATAICINGNTNLTAASWRGDLGAKPINGTVTAKRRCFISGFLNTGSYNGLDNNSGDYVQVWKDFTGQWYLGGSFAGAADPTVTATCVDTDAEVGVWGVPGAQTINLSYDPGAPNGIACGITKIGGNFLNGVSDGASIGFNFGTRYWNISVDAGKTAEVSCIR